MQVDLAEMARNTPPGMAAICGTGPKGKTCRECAFWGGNRVEKTAEQVNAKPEIWDRTTTEGFGSLILMADHSRRRWVAGIPLRQACMRYRMLRRGQKDAEPRSRRVEHHTPACSAFVDYPDPQPVDKPPKAVS